MQPRNVKMTTAAGLAALGAGGWCLSRFARSARAIDFADRVVVIVGGSRGLGLVLAREFARDRARLVLVARDASELERAKDDLDRHGALVSTTRCDVRNREQVNRTIERVVDEHGAIDVLINVAGIIQVGPMEHMTIADFEDALATHFWGPLYTILAALPHMKRAGARRIVNISSIGGRIAVPHLLPYSASKFALAGLSTGLRAELARDGFAVTTVYPGLMRTGSTYNARFKGRHRREFAWFHLADSVPGLTIDARRAARQIIEACRHGRPELILTPPARLAVLINTLAPRSTARALSLANRLLPSADRREGATSRSGWQSVSSWAPSALTRLADRATVENNELPEGAI